MKYFEKLIVNHLLSLAFLVVGILALTTGCAKKETGVIKIGAIAPLTGNAAVYGTALKKGMDLAIGTINRGGGVGGKKLIVIYEDSQADAKLAVSGYNKLVNVDKVSMILGDMFSSTTLAIAPIAQKEKIVLLSPTASAEAVPNTGDYIFSIYPSDSYDGKFIANFTYGDLGYRSAAVIYVQADAMLMVNDAFTRTLRDLGGKVVSEEGYAPKTDDFRSILGKINFTEVDVIFIPGYLEEIVKLLRQAKELGITKQFITISTAFDSKLFELSGDAAEGLLMSAPFFESASKEPKVDSFLKSFSTNFGEAPDVWAAYGYDVVNIAAMAYTKSLANKTKLKDELLRISDYPGVTGMTSFLENGGVDKLLRIMQVRGGRFVELTG